MVISFKNYHNNEYIGRNVNHIIASGCICLRPPLNASISAAASVTHSFLHCLLFVPVKWRASCEESKEQHPNGP